MRRILSTVVIAMTLVSPLLHAASNHAQHVGHGDDGAGHDGTWNDGRRWSGLGTYGRVLLKPDARVVAAAPVHDRPVSQDAAGDDEQHDVASTLLDGAASRQYAMSQLSLVAR